MLCVMLCYDDRQEKFILLASYIRPYVDTTSILLKAFYNTKLLSSGHMTSMKWLFQILASPNRFRKRMEVKHHRAKASKMEIKSNQVRTSISRGYGQKHSKLLSQSLRSRDISFHFFYFATNKLHWNKRKQIQIKVKNYILKVVTCLRIYITW